MSGRPWITNDGFRAGLLAIAACWALGALASLLNGTNWADDVCAALGFTGWWLAERELNDLRSRGGRR